MSRPVSPRQQVEENGPEMIHLDAMPDHEEKYSMDGSEATTDSLLLEKDLEAQDSMLQSTTPPPPPPEYQVSLTRKLIFLGLYFVLNLGMTLTNKAVMQRAKFPWLLTVSHSTATSIGCCALAATGHIKLSSLGSKEHMILIAFSTLFTLNIAVSNVSLSMVSVPFHQVLRSTTPVATILIYRVVYSRSYAKQTYLSMIPLIFGVGLATFGDYYFTILGFALTLLGVVLAATKSVATNRLMTGTLALGAIEILFRMAPLAAIQCLVYAAASGEIGAMRESIAEGTFSFGFCLALAGNALMAFCLNVVSFQTNKVAGALTVSVCGNLKQTLTILLGIFLFNVRVTALNGIGLVITMAGAAYYSSVELATKKAKASG